MRAATRPIPSSPIHQRLLISLLGILFLLGFAGSEALAHSLNDSYLDLSVDGESVSGSLRLGISDLEIALGLDRNGDAAITWGEIRQARPRIESYWQTRLRLQSQQQNCTFISGEYQVEQLAGGPYLSIPLQGTCVAPAGGLSLHYGMLFDVDHSHRGIVVVEQGGITSTHLLAPQRQNLELEPESASPMQTLAEFVQEGVWHIWIGIDHVLFLAAMLLGVVLHQRRGTEQSATIWRHCALETCKLVTAFTLAHSTTLVLASTGLVSLPPVLVESAIALSVIVSGINILVPIFGKHHWHVAFAFGLIHGFGFASVLGDLNLPASQFAISLLGFNLGVEVGQFVIVVCAVPLLLLLTSRPRIQQIGSLVSGLVIAQIGLFWLLERGF